MLETLIKTRFAPSPTGHIHLGNVRTALFNVLFARRHGGIFLLRIEDTDRERSRDEYIRDLEDDLCWLGLNWQEGPEIDGELHTYRQSERLEVYQGYYDRLIERERAYPCFCSDRTLKAARKALLSAGRPPRYPGTCARLTHSEIEERLSEGMAPTLRFRVPKGEAIEFDDLVRGPQLFAAEDIGDFVIRRSDGSPAFFFGNAVDDALMGVTHVFRGEDHITNTPRQLLLLRALDLRVPQYAHISLIVGSDGGPLSKRHGAHSVRKLRAQGYLPLAIVNHLARLGHVYDQNDLSSLEELAAGFEPGRLGRAPARHDEAQLLHWQKEAVTRLDDSALWSWLIEHDEVQSGSLGALVPEERRSDFAHCVRENIVFPGDARAWAGRLFHDPLQLSAEARSAVSEAGDAFFERALTQLTDGSADFRAYAKAVGAATDTKGKSLFMPLRAALTGETHGPEMTRVFALIGAERARARLEAARTLTR